MIRYYLITFLLVLVSNCSVIKDIVDKWPSDPEVEEPVKETPLKSLFPKQEWTDFTLDMVRKYDLAPIKLLDKSKFCEQGMNERNWVHLIAGMAKRESNFKPNTEYKENFKDSKGKYIISTGLLQLSQESARAYGCPMNSQADLKDPKKNIECGVRILQRWALRDGRLSGKVNGYWRGACARYWSVCRTSIEKTKAVVRPLCED